MMSLRFNVVMVMMIIIMNMMMKMTALSNEIKVHLFLERSEIFIWEENHHTINLRDASIKFCQLTITFWIIIASTINLICKVKHD